MPNRFQVAETGDIPAGRGKLVQAGGKQLALHNVDGRFYATESLCPHRGGPLGDAFQQGKCIVCPWHGWSFDVETGQGTLIPNTSIRTFPVTIEGVEIWVEVGD